MKQISLREHVPLQGIGDGYLLSKRGDLTFAWRIYLPVAYTVNEAGYDSIIKTLLQAYRVLPPYCVIHKQDVFRYDTYRGDRRDEFLARKYEDHFDGRRYLNGYCYLYLTFSTKSVIEAKSDSSGTLRPLSVRPPKEDFIRESARVASVFEAVVCNNALLEVERLSAADILSPAPEGGDRGLLADFYSFFADGPSVDYPLEPFADRIVCGGKEMRAWYVEDSDSYPGQVSSVCPVQAMSSGSSGVYLSGGSPIGYSLRFPHVVNRYIVTLPLKGVEKELEQKKRLMTSFSLYSSGCRVNSEELDVYLTQCARDGMTTVKCFTDILAWGSPSEMERIRSSVATAASNLNIKFCEETRVMPTLHYAAIPGAAAELGYDFYMTSEMSAFLCHGLWDGYDFGMKGGAVRLCDRRRMIPMTIDVQDLALSRGLVGNMNGFVIGPSGSGKSFFTNKMVKDFYVNGDYTLIIDVGNSYEGTSRVIREESHGIDGRYIACDPDNLIGFNPFAGWRRWNDVGEDGEKIQSGYVFILSLVRTMYTPDKGWKTETTGVLEDMLVRFLTIWSDGWVRDLEDDLLDAFVNEKQRRAERTRRPFDANDAKVGWRNPLSAVFPEDRREDPVFDDFYRFVTMVVAPLLKDENWKVGESVVTTAMFDVDSFAVAIGKYKRTGTYGYLLNTDSDEDIFSGSLTVVEVDKIRSNEDIFPLWMLCVIHRFEEKMYTLHCHKNLIIEEAWSAIARPSVADFIVWMWRTARKHSASAWVVTQSLSDLVSSPIVKDAIILNSDIKVLLDQRKNANNFSQAVEVLGLSAMQVSQILSLNRELLPDYLYKEVFIAIGENYSNVFAVEVSPEEAVVYESNGERKKDVFAIQAECGSYMDAVEETVRRLRDGRLVWRR